MINKIPILTDIKSFLPVARLYGYTFFKKYCTKTIIYDVLDCIVEINISLSNGFITFKSYNTTANITLDSNDKLYLLKNISHMIKWTTLDELEEY